MKINRNDYLELLDIRDTLTRMDYETHRADSLCEEGVKFDAYHSAYSVKRLVENIKHQNRMASFIERLFRK